MCALFFTMAKVDFTCKKVSLKELVQCNYDLNDSEYAIFSQLMISKKGLSVKELVENVEKDRTTVQKILTKLIKRNLISKRQLNLDRGFMFVYFSKNKNEVINEIEKNVEEYFNTIRKHLQTWKNNIE